MYVSQWTLQPTCHGSYQCQFYLLATATAEAEFPDQSVCSLPFPTLTITYYTVQSLASTLPHMIQSVTTFTQISHGSLKYTEVLYGNCVEFL